MVSAFMLEMWDTDEPVILRPPASRADTKPVTTTTSSGKEPIAKRRARMMPEKGKKSEVVAMAINTEDTYICWTSRRQQQKCGACEWYVRQS